MTIFGLKWGDSPMILTNGEVTSEIKMDYPLVDSGTLLTTVYTMLD